MSVATAATAPSCTDHALLVPLGHFAAGIGLLAALERVPIKMKTIDHRPGEKLAELEAHILAGGMPAWGPHGLNALPGRTGRPGRSRTGPPAPSGRGRGAPPGGCGTGAGGVRRGAGRPGDAQHAAADPAGAGAGRSGAPAHLS